MANYNMSFSSRRKEVIPHAAIRATAIYIPFKDNVHLYNSGGLTDKCFFLKEVLSDAQSKSGQKPDIFPWNEAMAENGRIYFEPYYDIKLLQKPEHADYKQVLVDTGKILQIELSSLLSPAASKDAADAVVRQIENGDVQAKFIDTSVLPEVQRDDELMSEGISKVLSAAKRGRKPKQAETA